MATIADYYYNYTANSSANSSAWDYAYIPSETEEAGVEPIMGNPKGAKYLISYAFKKDKDPVVFIGSKKELIKELKKLMNDEHVDQKTILVYEIKAQYKPKKAEIELVKSK